MRGAAVSDVLDESTVLQQQLIECSIHKLVSGKVALARLMAEMTRRGPRGVPRSPPWPFITYHNLSLRVRAGLFNYPALQISMRGKLKWVMEFRVREKA